MPGIEPHLLAQKPPSTPLSYGRVHVILQLAKVPAIYHCHNKTPRLTASARENTNQNFRNQLCTYPPKPGQCHLCCPTSLDSKTSHINVTPIEVFYLAQPLGHAQHQLGEHVRGVQPPTPHPDPKALIQYPAASWSGMAGTPPSN